MQIVAGGVAVQQYPVDSMQTRRHKDGSGPVI